MKKVKVAHIFNEINFSGAEVMYAQAVPLFQEQGFDLIAISTGKNIGNYIEQFQRANFTIYHKPLIQLRVMTLLHFIAYFINFYWFLRAEKIDVLHIHRSAHFWFFALCGYLGGLRLIFTVHNNFKNRKITWIKAYLERLSARKIFKMIFQSIGTSVHDNELNYYRNRTVKVNNWFDSSKFFPAKDDSEKKHARELLNITESEFVIVSTGSCSHVKNHSDIIRSLAILLSHFSCTYLHLGTGIVEQEEIDLAHTLGVEKKIYFVGNTDQVRQYLIASDVFVMPSKYEGLGNAAIEAMACKLPVVLYDVPGLKDLINTNDNGFLIAPNHEELAKALLVLQNDLSLRKKMGDSGCKFINSYFSIKDSVAQIADLYKSNERF